MSRQKKPRRRSRRERQRRTSGPREWVGGRLLSPFYITEDEPYRPEMDLWLELPDELLLACALIDRDAPPTSFGDSLVQTMQAPAAGPPRRPARVRVADARLAAEVRAAAPEITVDVAPTPELDRVLRMMAEHHPEGDAGEEPSYFEGGRVPDRAVEELFRAARLLHGVAPWKVAHDDQVVRLEIPQLGVEGACVSIIGALGESLGLIIFPSLTAYEAFVVAASEQRFGRDGPIDLGTTTLSLNFERRADLPETMRREAAERGYPVAGPAAYPWVQSRDRDGMPRPLAERDLRIASACATSLTTFFLKHRELFERESFDEPVSESFFDEDDLEVRITVPYEAGPQFGLEEPRAVRDRSTRSRPGHPAADRSDNRAEAPPAGKVGRNQPCPCGSGKKYKKCCLGQEQAARATSRAPATAHEVDQRLVEQMMRFAGRRLEQGCLERAASDFVDPEQSLQLLVPWTVYHLQVQGKPIVHWFVEERRRQLSNTELTWLQAQQASWLSVWEVLAVEPGSSITLRDLLTYEERTVHEISGSRGGLAKRDALLARIVDHEGISVLGGSHHRPLGPVDAAEVVRRMRARLRRKRAVPADRLRDEKTGRYMIARWEEAVDDADASRGVLPVLQNTDGDEMLLTVDHFELDASRGEEVEQRLAGLEDVDPPGPDAPDRTFIFTGPGGSTLIGRVTVSGSKLRLETNSIKRADLMRERIEGACQGLVRHRAREHSDPLAELEAGGRRPPKPRADGDDDLPPEEADGMIREFKAQHYAYWADQPLPALGGKSPREAIRTKDGRGQVDLLLKECENLEARQPAGQRFDFSALRRELGLEG